MSPLALAWRSLVYQPARAVLGIVGVAAVGALLFDMLLLAGGLSISFEQLLDSVAFDVRVTATTAPPGAGAPIRNAGALVASLDRLPELESVVPTRFSKALVEGRRDPSAEIEYLDVQLIGAGLDTHRTWSIVEGQDLDQAIETGRPPVLVNRRMAELLDLRPGSELELRGRCSMKSTMPKLPYRVSGIAAFPFDWANQLTAAVELTDFRRACGEENSDSVDMLLIASGNDYDAEAAVRAIRADSPGLHVFSNAQLLNQVQSRDFSYFRQISFALSVMTILFAFLLVASLLTVSVNQRFAEVAALRALGFSRWRIVADLLSESALLVGVGGLLSLPVGAAVALWLDSILREMPGLPERLHFFVFQPRALLLHLALLCVTGFLAALYPVFLAARLPISATLRKEVVS